MDPRYSVLLCGQALSLYEEQISVWLEEGIKVIWFGKTEEVSRLKARFQPFSDAFLLQAYECASDISGIIIDGLDDIGLIRRLEKECPVFNAAQYLVEHCERDRHIVVQASAGTGKTKVMVDRILYLMHVVKDLDMSEIFMITFTNDAADQMNRRLQDALITRYQLTKKKRYLRWLEQQSQMKISTIHSFAYAMLKDYGLGESFTKELSIRTFTFEKKELIKDALDQKTSDGASVISQLGVPFYRAGDIVKSYWDGITRLGISHRDMKALDWGTPADSASASFHRVITDCIEQLDDEYFELKRRNNAVSVDDIMRDLQEVLMDEDLPAPDLSMKFLFIDEFQDSDLSQIRVACLLAQMLDAKLFVVGDIKQSIYRFRGATDQAFAILKKDMKDCHLTEAAEFTLINNYRTAAGVLSEMDSYFRAWGRMGRLTYEKPVIPFHKEAGVFKIVPGARKEALDEQIADIVQERLDDLTERVEKSGKTPDEKDRVVLLTRSNADLTKLSGILRSAKIPASVRQEGSFYASETVRDFYLMVSSFLFSDEPKHIFNYLLTPYAGHLDSLDIHEMELLHGDYEALVEYLDHYLDQTDWKRYHRELRLRPVLAVFREMIEGGEIVENFIERSKTRKRANGWEEKACLAATFTEARQYQANLEKLLEQLQRNLTGDKVSLYDVYHFLQLSIATNRSESEAVVQSQDDYTSVLCMTVHKAKGLEFDTVILPYTSRRFPVWEQTEIVIDPVRGLVGWNYDGDERRTDRTYKYPKMHNDLYAELKEEDGRATVREECRILYVAMTRAIHAFIGIVPRTNNDRTWAYMLSPEGGGRYA